MISRHQRDVAASATEDSSLAGQVQMDQVPLTPTFLVCGKLTFLVPKITCHRSILRSSPLNSFHNYCRGFWAGEMLPSFDVSSYKCLFQLLQEHPPLVVLTRHPGRVDLSPYHKGIVGGNINDVEDDQGPAGSLPSAAVRFIHPIYPHPLVLLWDSTCRLPVVDLHLPNVAGIGVAGHP